MQASASLRIRTTFLLPDSEHQLTAHSSILCDTSDYFKKLFKVDRGIGLPDAPICLRFDPARDEALVKLIAEDDPVQFLLQETPSPPLANPKYVIKVENHGYLALKAVLTALRTTELGFAYLTACEATCIERCTADLVAASSSNRNKLCIASPRSVFRLAQQLNHEWLTEISIRSMTQQLSDGWAIAELVGPTSERFPLWKAAVVQWLQGEWDTVQKRGKEIKLMAKEVEAGKVDRTLSAKEGLRQLVKLRAVMDKGMH